ncbi:MAG: MAE_28990/MAE_18760 family HEPN-like nuclease [Deltaproteobacteria bacterium]|nr:MAE_28990/MAE_18760 family HEPN-like nuclease [Myxococcales bacterium]MDP3214042.1 MAE_28990/MAE_18760 family HEPN-like nuclease [Deltaproteobacteria bacterium]
MEQLELERIAEEFLRSSDSTYTECAHGIATLDRVIVSVSSTLAPQTRAALLPTLYAYWERFFKTVFSEYVRCVGTTTIPAERFCEMILKFRLKGEVTAGLKARNATTTNELIARVTTQETRAHFRQLHDLFVAPLSFLNPTDWVRTGSNVSYSVLQDNCANLGLSIDDIKRHLEPATILFRSLNQFVRDRNAIAHGENIGPVSSDTWEEQRTFVLQLMNAVQLSLYESMRDPQKILRP